MSEKIEEKSQQCYVFAAQITVLACIIPPVAETILNYFVYDCGNESYKLMSPTTYVGKIDVLLQNFQKIMKFFLYFC